MIESAQRRQLVRRLGLALLMGGCLLVVAAWARGEKLVGNLTEDLLQSLAWCLFYLPFFSFAYLKHGSRSIRRATVVSFALVIMWRLVDTSNHLEVLRSVPLIGADSPFRASVRQVLSVASFGALLVVIYVFYEELLATTNRLRESSARYQNLFDNMPTVCFTFDRTGRILSWNGAAERSYGYPAAEAIGSDLLDIITTPETLDDTRRMIARVFDGHEVLGAEWQDRDKNGVVGYRLRSVFPLRHDDGSVECGVNLSIDITDRKKAEAALARSQQERKLIMDNIPAMLAHVGNDLRYRYVNNRHAEWFNKTPDEIVGMRIDDLLGKVAYERIQPHIEAVLGGVSREFENNLRRDGGSDYWAQVSLVPDRGDHGAVVGYYVMVKDVTAQKTAECDAENERVLLRKLLDLQERERQTVTCDIHDGIVQYVVGAQMHVDACEATLDPHDRATAENLKLASRHLREAVREGRRLISDLRPPIIDESGLVAAIEHLICEMASGDGLRVEFKHHGIGRDLPPFLETALFRIVQEGLSNVRRHSGSQEAHVQLCRAQSAIQLDIRDRGCGFSRVDVPPNRFGLRGIEERARLFGGKASIESSSGDGTRIHVEMPFARDENSNGFPNARDAHSARVIA